MRLTVLQIDNRLREDATQANLLPSRGTFSGRLCPVLDAALRLSFTTENRIRVLSSCFHVQTAVHNQGMDIRFPRVGECHATSLVVEGFCHS